MICRSFLTASIFVNNGIKTLQIFLSKSSRKNSGKSSRGRAQEKAQEEELKRKLKREHKESKHFVGGGGAMPCRGLLGLFLMKASLTELFILHKVQIPSASTGESEGNVLPCLETIERLLASHPERLINVLACQLGSFAVMH